MDRPTLSTCIPTFNHADLLPLAVQAILRQQVLPDEIIILDDASTDGTQGYLDALLRREPRIRVERNDINQGVIATINRLAAMAGSQYVHFPASDDFLLPDFYAHTLKHLARHRGAGLSCMPFTFINEGEEDRIHEGGPTWSREAKFFSPDDLTRMSTLGSIHGNTVVIARDAFLEAGGLLPGLEWRSDWFCNWVVGFRHGMIFIPVHSAVVRRSARQYSQGMNHPEKDAQVVSRMIKTLGGVAYADARRRFFSSDVLFTFDFPALFLALDEAGMTEEASAFLCRMARWKLRAPAVPAPEPEHGLASYTYDHLRRSVGELVAAWRRSGKTVVIFGAGEHTGHLFKWTNLAEAPLLGIVDNNDRIHGKVFWGLEVHPVGRLRTLRPDVVLISSAIFQAEFVAQARAVMDPGVEIQLLHPSPA